MRFAKSRTVGLVIALAVLGSSFVTIAEAGSAAGPEAKAPKFKPRTLAKKRLTATRGGVVHARNGVELRVPAGLMRRNGIARIRQLSRTRFDLHIYAPWKGAVTVVWPRRKRKIHGVAHRVRGRWLVYPATVVGRRLKVRVRSLSALETDEPLRYGLETMNLSYTEFEHRKFGFVVQGCEYTPWDPQRGRCRKPWPYDSFDWTTDGCSNPTPREGRRSSSALASSTTSVIGTSAKVSRYSAARRGAG